MARMSTDDVLGRDTRLDHLAELCGWSRRETAGCLQLDVWPLCYDRVTPNIPPGDVDRAANRFAVSPVKFAGGFSAALVECGLARPATKSDRVYRWEKEDGSVVDLEWRDPEWRGRIYLKGAADRIAYIVKKKVSGRHGGKRSAESRSSSQAVLQAPLQGPFKHTTAELNPSVTPTVTPTATDHIAPDPAPVVPLALVPETERKQRAPRQPSGDHQTVIAAFNEWFVAAYETKPTWGAKQGARVNRLLKQHSVSEILRRIEILFASPPSWLVPPFDLGTLEQHFDKLAQPATKPRGHDEPRMGTEL